MQLFDIIAVSIVIVAALAYLIRRWLKNVQAGQTVGSGCSGCSGGCSAAPQDKDQGAPLGDLRTRD